MECQMVIGKTEKNPAELAQEKKDLKKIEKIIGFRLKMGLSWKEVSKKMNVSEENLWKLWCKYIYHVEPGQEEFKYPSKTHRGYRDNPQQSDRVLEENSCENK